MNEHYTEAQRILAGKSMLLPTIEHLRAVEEHYQTQLVRVANQVELIHRYIDAVRGEKIQP